MTDAVFPDPLPTPPPDPLELIDFCAHDADGNIVRSGKCSRADFEVMAGWGDATYIEGSGGPDSHYVNSGSVHEYTEQERAARKAAPAFRARWDIASKAWIDVRGLVQVKRDARQRMAAAWNNARAGGVTLGTKTAPTDADSWTRYLAIKEMAADGGWVDVPIPLSDGTFELMTQAKMVTLWGALKTFERTLLARLRDRSDAIAVATTKAQVEAIVW